MRDLFAKLRSGLKPHSAGKASSTGPNYADNFESARGRARLGEMSSQPVPGRSRRRVRSQVYGAAILLATTVLWASGGPTSKYLFLLPTPPSAALLTACISVITALFLGVGLLGTAMEAGSGGGGGGNSSRRQAAATAGADGGAAAAADLDADEAEAEALLHSGMHATGGAGGGALTAAAAAAREAAQEQERQRAWECEQAWVRAHECALPLLPSHGSHYYYSKTTASGYGSGLYGMESSTAAAAAAAGPSLRDDNADATQRLLDAALGNEPAGGSGRDVVVVVGGAAAAAGARRSNSSGGGGGAHPGRLDGVFPTPGPHVRRGPSLDGTTAAVPSLASPPPRLRPYTATDPSRRASGGGSAGARSSGRGAAAAAAAGRWRLRLLTAPARSLLSAGLELGVYNVTAAALGAWGMQRISATRSAFLAQATSLLTPLLVWLSGGRVGLVVWIACCCGAVGGAMVALDNVYGSAAASAAASTAGGHSRLLLDGGGAAELAAPFRLDGGRVLLSGDAAAAAGAAAGRWQVEGVLLSRQAMGAAYVLLSCVFWGLGTVRLGVHSARFPPLHLAAAAAVSYAALSLLWLLGEVLGSPAAGLSDYLELGLLVRNHVTAALLLWAGLGPGALSSYQHNGACAGSRQLAPCGKSCT